jgi:hypothetical protein
MREKLADKNNKRSVDVEKNKHSERTLKTAQMKSLICFSCSFLALSVFSISADFFISTQQSGQKMMCAAFPI